jgi:hypothetical protein
LQLTTHAYGSRIVARKKHGHPTVTAGLCDAAHINDRLDFVGLDHGWQRDQPVSSRDDCRKGYRMSKIILTIATVAALAAAASAPAEARTLRLRPTAAEAAATAATLAAATIAADAYVYGSGGYYVAPAPFVYGAPVYLGYGYRF